MKRLIFDFVASFAFFFAFVTASHAAPGIHFERLASVPEQFVVRLSVSGFGDGSVNYPLGGFEATFDYEPAALAPTLVEFGTFLGDPALLDALTDIDFAPSALNVAAISLLTPEVLFLIQPTSFELVTVTFDIIGPLPRAPVVLSDVELTDAYGNGYPVDEPTSLLLALSMLAAVVLSRQRRPLASCARSSFSGI